MQPIVLFDKSTIEMLNVDEAAIFDCLYMTNICPIYFVEVLADLGKARTSGRSHEKVVADIAKKTPVMHAYFNVWHSNLSLAELLGEKLNPRNVPHVGGGVPVRAKGKSGVIFSTPPEREAFDRWQKHEFEELERKFASVWRRQLETADLGEIGRLVKGLLAQHANPKSEQEIYHIATEAVLGKDQEFTTLKIAFALLGHPKEYWSQIQHRWQKAGYPSLTTYAPFTAHCLLVDVFFYLAVNKQLISPDRPSNRSDFTYLYYLPFAQCFASNDKLHKRMVPLFLKDKQMFLDGQELKTDMQRLDTLYSQSMDKIHEIGLFKFSNRPPLDPSYFTTRVWQHFGYKLDDKNLPPQESPTLAAEIMERIKAMEEQAGKQKRIEFSKQELTDPDTLAMKRLVPLKRGKWRMLPREVIGS